MLSYFVYFEFSDNNVKRPTTIEPNFDNARRVQIATKSLERGRRVKQSPNKSFKKGRRVKKVSKKV